MIATLYYIHDPMCSWCWAFRPTLDRLIQALPLSIQVAKRLGGLAPDTMEPMPQAMRDRLQQTWRRIEQTVPGVHFNFDFWQRNTPRRATYPACRALIAARDQGSEEAMLRAIQRAYYEQARNPSDDRTLIALAGEVGLDTARFTQRLAAAETQRQLEAEIAEAGALGVDSYPSLVLQIGTTHWPVSIDYLDAAPMLETIEWLLEESAAME